MLVLLSSNDFCVLADNAHSSPLGGPFEMQSNQSWFGALLKTACRNENAKFNNPIGAPLLSQIIPAHYLAFNYICCVYNQCFLGGRAGA